MKTYNLATVAGSALALLVTLGTPAVAGDWNNGAGSVKDSYGTDAIAVPAPVPSPDYAARWYLRGDVGIGFGASPSIGRSGQMFGRNDSPGVVGPIPPGGPVAFGMNEGHFTSYGQDDEFAPMAVFGVGAGVYLGRGFRADITGEYRGRGTTTATGTYQYNQHAEGPGANPGDPNVWNPLVDCCGTPNRRVDGEVSDKAWMRSGLFMVNGYWDLARGGRFTPYVGAGIGLSLNDIRRTFSATETICDPTAGLDCQLNAANLRTHSGSSKDFSASLAASLMAGVAYQLSDNVKLDFNYRYLYIGGTSTTTTITNNETGVTTASVLKIADTQEHQLRVGLRWDLN